MLCNQYRAAADKEKRDEAFFLDGLRNMGKLYDFDSESDGFDFLSFQHILDELDENFNVTSLLKSVNRLEMLSRLPFFPLKNANLTKISNFIIIAFNLSITCEKACSTLQ